MPQSPPVMLHKFWWLWLPLIFVVAQAALEIFAPPAVKTALMSEHGTHEFAQAFLMLIAFILSWRCMAAARRGDAPAYIYGWLGIAALASFYVMGEEVSWGQHIWDWATPEFWMNVNDQGETNLHNTSSWFDQKPRLILEIGVIVGGLLIPALQRYKSDTLPKQFTLIYPTAKLVPVSLLALGITVLDKVDKGLDSVALMERASEVEELFLFYFVVLYLVILRRRLRAYKGDML